PSPRTLLAPPRSTLFPYTTLFRSGRLERDDGPGRSRRRSLGSWALATRPGTLGSSSLRPRDGHLRSRFRRGRATSGGEPRSDIRSEEHTSELQSRFDLVCRLLLEK